MNDNPRVAVLRAGATYLQAIGCLVLLALPASAGDPLHDLLGCPVPDCIGKWCRADYCPKKEPYVCVPLRFGCDDYCGKTAPCVCAPLRFGCDDYRKKCLPKVCCVPHCQYLSCGPTGACGCADCDRLPCDAYPTPPLALERPLHVIEDDPLHDKPLPAPPQPFAPVVVRGSDFKLTK